MAAVPASFLIRRLVDDREELDPLTSGPAPAFTLTSLDGETVSLDGLRGRPVAVNFWGSWCEQCRNQLPLLAQARERHPELAVVGVLFRDDPDAARAEAEAAGADWPSVVDPDGAVARAYGVESAPATFFVTRDGEISGLLVGPVSRRLIDRQLSRIL